MGSEVNVIAMGGGRMEVLVGKRHLNPAFFLSGVKILSLQAKETN